jgi:hypothetical protein
MSNGFLLAAKFETAESYEEVACAALTEGTKILAGIYTRNWAMSMMITCG